MGLMGVDDGKGAAAAAVSPMDLGCTADSVCRTDWRRLCELAAPHKDVAALRRHQRHQRSLELNKVLNLLKEDIKRMMDYQPKIRNLLDVDLQDQQKICALRRNQSVKNLRCLTTFYGFHAKTFCLATNLLDRFTTKVKVQPRYLPCAAAACFLTAAAECEESDAVPQVAQLLRVSQCDCTPGDVARMQAVVRGKVSSCVSTVIVPLTLVERLVAALAAWVAVSAVAVPPSTPAATAASVVLGGSAGARRSPSIDEASLARTARSKLCSVLCQADLLLAKPTIIALSVVRYCLEESGLTGDEIVINYFVMLQDVCDVGDAEFSHYYENLRCYLGRCDDPLAATAMRQWPRADMRWTISRRTMAQLRPSCSAVSDLPVIHESPCDESLPLLPLQPAAAAVPFCCNTDVVEDALNDDDAMMDVQRDDDDDVSSISIAAAVAAPLRSWASVVAAASAAPDAAAAHCVGSRCCATAVGTASISGGVTGAAAAAASSAARLGFTRS